MRRCLAMLLLAGLAAADDKLIPPTIDRQVEPEWDADLQKFFLTSPVKVEIVIDPAGRPFSLKSSGLPDNIVKAIAEWKFHPGKKDGKNSAFAMTIVVQNRTALSPGVERSLRRRFFAAPDLAKEISEGAKLDPAEAKRIAALPQTDPESAHVLPRLLAYAAGPAAEPAEARRTRAQIIAWLAEHEPDSPLARSPLAFINSLDGPLADRAGYEQVRQVWLRQLSDKPEDATVLENATGFLRLGDPYAAEAALTPQLAKVADAGTWLGELYALTVLGVTSFDLQSGAPATVADPVPDTPFVRKAKSSLSTTSDPRIVLSAALAAVRAGHALAKSNHLPASFPSICAETVARAKQIYPGTVATCDLNVDPFPENAGLANIERIRVGGNVQRANLTKKVIPRYPEAAKQLGIQGTIEFTAIIGKSGKVESLILTNGPLVFYEGARAAVLQWEYRPTQLNGKPVEVITKIDVNYELRSN